MARAVADGSALERGTVSGGEFPSTYTLSARVTPRCEWTTFTRPMILNTKRPRPAWWLVGGAFRAVFGLSGGGGRGGRGRRGKSAIDPGQGRRGKACREVFESSSGLAPRPLFKVESSPRRSAPVRPESLARTPWTEPAPELMHSADGAVAARAGDREFVHDRHGWLRDWHAEVGTIAITAPRPSLGWVRENTDDAESDQRQHDRQPDHGGHSSHPRR